MITPCRITFHSRRGLFVNRVVQSRKRLTRNLCCLVAFRSMISGSVVSQMSEMVQIQSKPSGPAIVRGPEVVDRPKFVCSMLPGKAESLLLDRQVHPGVIDVVMIPSLFGLFVSRSSAPGTLESSEWRLSISHTMARLFAAGGRNCGSGSFCSRPFVLPRSSRRSLISEDLG